MSDNNSQHPSPPPRGTGRRGRGRGRGGAMSARGGIKKAPGTGRRGRQKVYESSRVQAAHERQRELKAAYNQVSTAVRAALEDLAERNLNVLKKDPVAHEKTDEYQQIKAFLDQRLEDRQSELNLQLEQDLATHAHELNVKHQYAEDAFKSKWDDATEEFYDAQLRRLDILEELYNNREPVTKPDDGFDFREISEEQVANNGPYLVVNKDGIEVPFPHVLPDAPGAPKKGRMPRTPSKRKAEGAPDGQPTPKRPASAFDENEAPDVPRHIGGLLSAVAPPEDPASPAEDAASAIDDDDAAAIEDAATSEDAVAPVKMIPYEITDDEADDDNEDEEESPAAESATKSATGPNGALPSNSASTEDVTSSVPTTRGDGGRKRKAQPDLRRKAFKNLAAKKREARKLLVATCKDSKQLEALPPLTKLEVLHQRREKESKQRALNEKKMFAELAEENKDTDHILPKSQSESKTYRTVLAPPVTKTSIPALPNGAGEEDEYGVRLVDKRIRANDYTNNRIMVPPTFWFKPHEIGYRDSTNDKSRGATKAKRGQFLDTPNTPSFHVDRILWSYDATKYADGDLDEKEIEKHKLHPKYGLFLKTSENAEEPPKPHNTGSKPVVYVTPSGQTLHASRSMGPAKAEESAKRLELQAMIHNFAEEEDIADDDIKHPATDRLLKKREEHRLEREVEEDEVQEQQDQEDFANNVQILITAATDSDETDAKTRSPAVQRRATVSREYDAVRDIFMNPEPAVPDPPAAPTPAADTSRMEVLADTALDLPHPTEAVAQPPNVPPPQQQIAPPEGIVIDPRLDGGQGMQYPPLQQGDRNQQAMPLAYPEHMAARDQQAYPHPANTYPQPMAAVDPRYQDPLMDPRLHDQQYQAASGGLQQPNNFFRMALNNGPDQGPPPPPPQGPQYPGQGYQPLAPAPQYGAPAPAPRRAGPQDGSPARIPFTRNPAGVDERELPPLRPYRGPGQPMPPAEPGLQQPALAAPAAQYYPAPPPPSQPQNGYNQGHGLPVDAAPPQQQNVAGQYPPPPYQQQQAAPYPLSPPQYAYGPPGSAGSPPPSSGGHSGATPPPRRGGSVSSNPQNSKYVKLAPAPIPAHRQWNNSGPELRTVQYNPQETIRDYSATVPPPSHGPTLIRGWANVTGSKKPRGPKAEGAVSGAEPTPQAQEEPK